MKTTTLFLLLSTFMVELVGSNFVYGGGIPHTAYGKVFNSNGLTPANNEIQFNSYITTRPGEILTESSTGCSYSAGYWNVGVGNFPTAWSVGEVLHTDVTNIVNNETGSVEVVMTSAGSDAAPDLHLEEVVPVELAFFNAVSDRGTVILTWATETETNNFGFEIQKKQNDANFKPIGFVKGHGTISSPHYYCYTDHNVSQGMVSYRLKQIDNDGSCKFSPITSPVSSAPASYDLIQNYPNPFNSQTRLTYQVGKDEPGLVDTKLYIYNSLGELVRTLVNGHQAAGQYSITWDGRNDNGQFVVSGVYIARLITRNHSSNLKMIYLR